MKILIAFLFLFVGVYYQIDWFVFCDKHRELMLDNYDAFINLYRVHFAEISPITNFTLFNFCCIGLLTVAAIIFFRKTHLIFKILGGFTCFVAFTYLWEMM